MRSRHVCRIGGRVMQWLSSSFRAGHVGTELLGRNALFPACVRTVDLFNFSRGCIGSVDHRSASGQVRRMSIRKNESQVCKESDEAASLLEVVQYLDSLKNFEKQGVPMGAGTDTEKGFDLDRMRRLLARLDDPHMKYPVVHVGGTKGKGSTATFISSILRAAGFSVGTYTSPHVSTIRERIVSGKGSQAISVAAFRRLYHDLREEIHEMAARESGALTYFEVFTALAFTHFAREGVDIAVIEVGLGGARDATNVVPASGVAASVIVSISEEHLGALGGSLQSVALAKAGIIKEGRPVILGRQPHGLAEQTICSVAAAQMSNVIKAFGTSTSYSVKDFISDSVTGCAYQLCDLTVDLDENSVPQVFHAKDLKLRLLGVHQLYNAFSAVCTALCLRTQGWHITDDCIKHGLENASLSGRFQVLSREQAEQLGCGRFTVILDGAHTPESAAALANTLQALFPHHHLALVVAMASDKDHEGFASSFLHGSSKKPGLVMTTQVLVAGSFERSTSANLLTQAWTVASEKAEIQRSQGAGRPEAPGAEKLLGLGVHASVCIASALREATTILENSHSEEGLICVTGSLHAVGLALSLLEQ